MSRPAVKPVLPIGESIWLKSGGPEMTVVFDDADGTVHATWFDREERCHQTAFPRGGVETETERRRRQEGNLGRREADERPARPILGGRFGRTADGLPFDDDIPF